MPEFLVVKEVATILRVHAKTVIRLIRSGELKAFSVSPASREYRINRSDLTAFTEKRRASHAPRSSKRPDHTESNT